MKESNYSERFTAILSGLTGSSGTDPQVVHECIRHEGLIEQSLLPMTKEKDTFFDEEEITKSLRARGQNWLYKNEYKHEWLWSNPRNRPENYKSILKDALKSCPVAVSVSAWNRVGDEYVSYGDVNNHYCLLYKIDEEGHPWVFDSYDHNKKKLAKDHNIRRAKRIWVNRKTISALKKHRSILEVILDTLTMRKSLIDLCKESLGKDVTPDDLVPDSVACAITVSTLIHSLDATFPKVAGTWSLFDCLEHRKDYEKVPVPIPGSIIISPTGMGKKGTNGHVGIIMENNVIASNDSNTGKFMQNYTLDTWTARYKDALGYPVLIYKKK